MTRLLAIVAAVASLAAAPPSDNSPHAAHAVPQPLEQTAIQLRSTIPLANSTNPTCPRVHATFNGAKLIGDPKLITVSIDDLNVATRAQVTRSSVDFQPHGGIWKGKHFVLIGGTDVHHTPFALKFTFTCTNGPPAPLKH